jgi:hypothetical protein
MVDVNNIKNSNKSFSEEEAYLLLVMGYDFCRVFEKKEMVCDEVFDLSIKIINDFKTHPLYTDKSKSLYDAFQDYLEDVGLEKFNLKV